MHRQEGTLVQVKERRSIFSPFNSLLSWFSLSSYVGHMASFGIPVKDKLASYIPESGLGFSRVLLTRALTPPPPRAPQLPAGLAPLTGLTRHCPAGFL